MPVTGRWRRSTDRTHRFGLAAIGALILAVVGANPGHAAKGGTQQCTYNSATGPVHFLVYTPSTYDPARPAPLAVGTTGSQAVPSCTRTKVRRPGRLR